MEDSKMTRKYRYQILVTVETVPFSENGENNEPNAFVEISNKIDERIKSALRPASPDSENEALAEHVKINYCGILDINTALRAGEE